jgi:hypothetical protein
MGDNHDEIRSLLIAATRHKVGRPTYGIDDRAVLAALPASLVDGPAELLLLELVDALWADGWQPVELARQGRRGCAAAGGRLVEVAIAADDAHRPAATLHHRWKTQIEELALPATDGAPGWIRSWIRAERFDRAAVVAAIVDAVANLRLLPPLEALIPPPGADGSSSRTEAAAWSAMLGDEGPAGGRVDPVLGRIRALLAKAESTTFEAEATALTAKAQELMTRHAIDAALLAGRSGGSGERPVMVRLPVDAPYVDAKCLLLQTVADAGRCRAVAMTALGLSTVVGFADDVAAVELLFTSLLLQAQTALAEAARRAPAGTVVRSQAFRSAFLQAYTNRIGERLREINDAVFAAADPGQAEAFLPVLRSRADRVDEVIDEHFGTLTSSRVRGGYDPAGWASGTVAADHARLDSGQLDDRVAPGV